MDLTCIVRGGDACEEDPGPASDWGEGAAWEGAEEIFAYLLDAAVGDVTAKNVDEIVSVRGPATEKERDVRLSLSEGELD